MVTERILPEPGGRAPDASEVDVVRPRDARAAPRTPSTLAFAASGMKPQLFGIMDGGHFDDLPSGLSAAGLSARSLFLGHGNQDVERHGPWLVRMPSSRDVDLALDLIGSLPAIVFWSCPAGDMALFHHLRRLNMVRLPVWAAAGRLGPDPDDPGDRGWRSVLFRHWDPGVLGALLPCLDETQFNRLLGPACEIVFDPLDGHGAKRVVADPGWPVSPAGPLTIRPEQVEALTARRVAESHSRVADYLRDVFPEAMPSYSDQELQTFVRDADTSGRQLGIRTEAGHKRWAYLVMASEGQVARTPGALDFIRHGGSSPDDQVRQMIAMLAGQMQQRGG